MLGLKSLQSGLALGLAGQPLILESLKIVAYRYNTIVAAELPKVDWKEFPYAVIIYQIFATHLLLSKTPWYATGNEYNGGHFFYNGGHELKCTDPSAWFLRESSEGVYSWIDDGDNLPKEEVIGRAALDYDGDGVDDLDIGVILWSNHDISDPSTGTVYVAASEPVPVYD